MKQLCLFVLSSQELINKFIGLLTDYEIIDDLLRELSVFLLNNVINVLKNLIGFIYDTDYNKIAESGSTYLSTQITPILKSKGYSIRSI